MASTDVATKQDLLDLRADLEKRIEELPTKKDLEAFATKKDLEAFATKKDLEAFATKKDLEAFATKKDLEAFVTKKDAEAFATKDDMRQLGARFESLESSVRLLAEGLVATREHLERRIDAVDERLATRISIVEEVVRENSRDIRKNGDALAGARAEISELRRDWLRGERVELLEARVAALEARVKNG